MDNFELWYRANRAKIASGAPPLTFQGTGQPTKNWTIYGHTSANLFDVSAASADLGIDRDTGEIVESSESSVSDWIAYDSSQGLFISAQRIIAAATSIIFAFYDSEKNYIDWVGVAFSSGQHSYEVTEIPDSAAFFRVQFFDDGFSNVMINQGETALPYEPFGAVGERTENLFNKDGDNYGYFNTRTGDYVNDRRYRYFRRPVTPGNVLRMSNKGRGAGCAFYKGTWVASITQPSSFYIVPDGVDEVTNNYAYTDWDSALVTINTPLPTEYVPYGYKIPITCGGETTNIYIGDTPLGTGQTVTGSETGVAIPTVDGQNTLSVGTTVQPSKVVISAASGMTESVKKYFDYKYGVLKMAGVKE